MRLSLLKEKTTTKINSKLKKYKKSLKFQQEFLIETLLLMNNNYKISYLIFILKLLYQKKN